MCVDSLPGRAFCAARHRASDVQKCGQGRTARQHKRIQRGQGVVELVAPRFQPIDVALCDPQRRVFGIFDHRGGQVSTCIEEVVLNLPQHLANLLIGVSQCDCDADCGICLVTIGVCGQSRVIL
jgi:hypothetical protein